MSMTRISADGKRTDWPDTELTAESAADAADDPIEELGLFGSDIPHRGRDLIVAIIVVALAVFASAWWPLGVAS